MKRLVLIGWFFLIFNSNWSRIIGPFTSQANCVDAIHAIMLPNGTYTRSGCFEEKDDAQPAFGQFHLAPEIHTGDPNIGPDYTATEDHNNIGR